jgi:transformation/transcription domain-associated protein
MDGETLITGVNKAVTAIMQKLQRMFDLVLIFIQIIHLVLIIWTLDLAIFDGTDSKVAQLVAAANSHDNLCRMDPAWHPWL